MLFHPLSGANPTTLFEVIWRNGGVAPRCWPHLAIAASSAVLRWPFTATERLVTRRRVARHGAMPPPIFIVGHWRSGTTHLYNIMSQSERFGYVPPLATGLPWDMFLLARMLEPALRRLLPKHRFIDPIPVHPDSPQEDEAALANMQPLSFYHGLYFPRRLRENVASGVFFESCDEADVRRWRERLAYFLRKVSLLHDDKPLLVKNPVYTARIGMLREMYPGARFIHIHRHPLVVFHSMRNFYRRMLEAMALQPFDLDEVDELILEVYSQMMDRLIEEAAQLPAHEFMEVGYDELDAAPLETIERIYDRLALGDFDQERPRFESYLATVRGYRRNRYVTDAAVEEHVRARWRPFIQHWGYAD